MGKTDCAFFMFFFLLILIFRLFLGDLPKEFDKNYVNINYLYYLYKYPVVFPVFLCEICAFFEEIERG